MQAANFVQAVEDRQGMMISCPEEIAYRMGYIDADELHDLGKVMESNQYGQYLINLITDEDLPFHRRLTMKILLIGKNGQVGWELQRTLAPLGEVVAVDFPEIDLSDEENTREWVRRIEPQVLINAAAYTAVDKAESETELAMAINGTAPGVLAEEAQALGSRIGSLFK